MKVHVVGRLSCDFVERATGERVQGISLKVNFKSSNTKLEGLDVTKVWLPQDMVDFVGYAPQVGDELELKYEYDGRRSYLVEYEKIN